MKYIILIIVILILIIISWIVFYQITRRRIIRNLLIKLINEFEKHKIKYWIDFGSLLGITREQDIIIGDNDGDVCILAEDEENTLKVKQIVEEMNGKYFEWGAFRVYECVFFIDIYLVQKEGMNLSFPGEEMIIPQEYILPISNKNVKIGDKTVSASLPKNHLELLELRYGTNWKISRYKWYTLYL